jgi:hypothetical protein
MTNAVGFLLFNTKDCRKLLNFIKWNTAHWADSNYVPTAYKAGYKGTV